MCIYCGIISREEVCTLCQYWVDLEPVIKSTHKGEDERYYVIAQHRVYTVEPDWEDSTSRGDGGKKHTLQDIATREVTVTTNLWFVGILPPAFWERLPDTHILDQGGDEPMRES
jgi:hypothetical protein